MQICLKQTWKTYAHERILLGVFGCFFFVYVVFFYDKHCRFCNYGFMVRAKAKDKAMAL